jgi:gas vesicle protein
MEGERSGHGYAWGMMSFLVGGLIGAGVALLLAPKSGKEARARIRDIAEEVKETTGDHYERAKKTVASALEDGYERVKNTVASTLEDGQELLEEKKDLIASAVKAGIETFEKTRKKHG